jgi:hypothetical protein
LTGRDDQFFGTISVSAWCPSFPIHRGRLLCPLRRFAVVSRRGLVRVAMGRLHQLFSRRELSSDRWIPSTASHVGSLLPALYRGRRVLSAEAKRLIECRPNLASSSAKSRGVSWIKGVCVSMSPFVVVEVSTKLVGPNVGCRSDVACPEVDHVLIE